MVNIWNSTVNLLSRECVPNIVLYVVAAVVTLLISILIIGYTPIWAVILGGVTMVLGYAVLFISGRFW